MLEIITGEASKIYKNMFPPVYDNNYYCFDLFLHTHLGHLQMFCLYLSLPWSHFKASLFLFASICYFFLLEC